MVLQPVDGNQLSDAEKRASLQYLMFLKEKHSGLIKGRGCVDGQKQRLYMDRQQISAPTIVTESLLLTCLIDALERRDVATVNIPGSFMQSDMEGEERHMKLEGKMVDILEKLTLVYTQNTKLQKTIKL